MTVINMYIKFGDATTLVLLVVCLVYGSLFSDNNDRR